MHIAVDTFPLILSGVILVIAIREGDVRGGPEEMKGINREKQLTGSRWPGREGSSSLREL